MTDRHAPIMICCVCGCRLPVLPNRQAYIDKGCAVRLPTGQQLYYCPGTRHTQQEIQEAITGIPRWTTGKVLKDRQRLV